MTLYLARHAEAVPVGGVVARDAERTLTADGDRVALLVGAALARVEPPIPLVLCSPLRRAVQTAERFAGALGGAAVRPTESLAPGFRRRALLEEVLASGAPSVVAVGHQPDLSGFLCYLIADAAPAAVAFPPCAVARVSVPPGGDGACLEWLLPPALLTLLAAHPGTRP